MADQGATFQIDLAVGGAGAVDAASASLDSLAKRLEAGQASYKSAQAAADKTAKSLERIGVAADAQRGKLQKAMDTGDLSGADKAAARLRALVTQQDAAATKAKAAKTALDQEATSLDKLAKEESAAEAAAKKAAGTTAKAADEGDGNARRITSGLRKIGGPLGDIGSKAFETKEAFTKLQEGFGDAGPAVIAAVGATAVTAAIVALAAAAVAGLAAIGAWALGLADAARSEDLLAQGIAHSVAGGKALDTQINSLARKLPLTTEELSSMADGLSKAGLRGAALTSTLEKNATAAAKLKFGPDFEDQMDSLEEQSKKLKLGIASIFGGLKIDAFLKALSTITDLFSEDDAAGQGLKVLFETLFQPLVDGVTGFVPKARSAFLQLEILALKAAIAIKPYTSKIEEVVEAFVLLGAVVVGVVLVAFAALAAWAAIGVGILAGIVAVVYKVSTAFQETFTTVVSFLSSINLSDIGAQMIQGLINGITGAGSAVVDSVKGVVNGAIDSAKAALGIHSPSKVFAEIGENTAAGMEQGVTGGSSGVQGAIEDMSSPPSGSASGGASASTSSSSSGSSGGFNFQGAQFTFNGVKDAEDAEARFGELLTKLIEGDLSQLGAAVPST